jgi:hypothetical protein
MSTSSSSSQTVPLVLSSNDSLYLETLNDREMKAYFIAKEHLGMTFHLQKSNGYREWQKKTISTEETKS